MTRDVRQRISNGTAANKDEKNPKDPDGHPKYWDPLTDGVKWIEKYAEPLEDFFKRLPEFISTFIATLAVFTFGATLRGQCHNDH